MNDDPYDLKSDWFGASLFNEHPVDCSDSSWPTVGSVTAIKITLIADFFSLEITNADYKYFWIITEIN